MSADPAADPDGPDHQPTPELKLLNSDNSAETPPKTVGAQAQTSRNDVGGKWWGLSPAVRTGLTAFVVVGVAAIGSEFAGGLPFPAIAGVFGGPEESAQPRRLTTSTKCRQALEYMLNDDGWIRMNRTYTRWCRIKTENEMARCCKLADFELGRGEECETSFTSGVPVETECFAKCHHSRLAGLCNSWYGRACEVERKIFKEIPLKVSETFCVPEECDNSNDRDNLINWFSTLYAKRLNGWHGDWDSAELLCPAAAIGALIWTGVGLILAPALCGVLYIVCVAPKEKGRLLITQEEMQAEANAENNDSTPANLRGTARTVGDAPDQTK